MTDEVTHADLAALRDEVRSGFSTIKERLSSLETQQSIAWKTLANQGHRDVLLQGEIDRLSERVDRIERTLLK